MENIEEQAYLNLLRELLAAPVRQNRTDVLTRGVFGRMLRFKLHHDGVSILPLLTTKKMAWKAIYHELIWFLSGKCYNIDYLKKHNVKIWDGNTSKEYLSKYGFTNFKEGETGEIYGIQWRHWNGIKQSDGSYSGGIDQISNIIEMLKKDPWSRRIILNAWNCSSLKNMVLVPCHVMYQFYVEGDEKGNPKYLNCMMTQRSADSFLGLPFNIISTSLLVYIIALIVNLIPNEIVISIADAHIYENQLEAVKTQIERTPKEFPSFKFSDRIMKKENITIDDFVNEFTIDDFIIENYNSYSFIKCDMVA